jgi:hypothetical protein
MTTTTKIDWTRAEEELARTPWQPGPKPDPNAAAYEQRKARVVAHADVPADEAGLLAIYEEVHARGYRLHARAGDGLWACETRFID